MRRLPPLGMVGFLVIRGFAGAQQVCDTFPWTITATPVGGASALIAVCCKYAGCIPHAPSYQIAGSLIDVTLLGGEAPDRCQCTAVEGTFAESLLVSPLPPGTYSVHVSFLDCFNRIPEGDTSIVVGGGTAATVPALDARGAAIMLVLMAAVAAWRLK